MSARSRFYESLTGLVEDVRTLVKIHAYGTMNASNRGDLDVDGIARLLGQLGAMLPTKKNTDNDGKSTELMPPHLRR